MSRNEFFIIIAIAVVVIFISVLPAITPIQYSQLVCEIRGKESFRSKVYRSSQIYKNSDSVDYVIGNRTYNPAGGEQCYEILLK